MCPRLLPLCKKEAKNCMRCGCFSIRVQTEATNGHADPQQHYCSLPPEGDPHLCLDTMRPRYYGVIEYVPWQHLINALAHPHHVYVTLPGASADLCLLLSWVLEKDRGRKPREVEQKEWVHPGREGGEAGLLQQISPSTLPPDDRCSQRDAHAGSHTPHTRAFMQSVCSACCIS